MPLSDTINNDIKDAMKSGNALKLSTLRLLKAALTNAQIEKRKDKLDDAECADILQKQVKQRKDSIESYKKAGRTDMVQKETDELNILMAYLPKQMSDDELKAIVRSIIEKTGVKSQSEAGKIMKELMPQVKGKADGARVQEVVRSLLA